ncbi:hypothetical protein BT96DRAFT_914385 [Gymnopus androsaceus JB14]|uniref:Uncharacterized protein n=1 Tax=Gymnopus androsaceus JB14 TaxID=1447944 RepID=A0A6A4IEH3_9AGAR|nr:hypothetical protein BT96DRAFT_914385 [Gymnopus androsaceus JB14]
MKFFAVSVVAASVLPSILAQALTVNTPSGLATCEPTLLAWSGGVPPYYLSIIPGNNTAGSALKTFDSTSTTSYTWTVDLAAGTPITVALKDNTGAIAYSDETNIAAGSSNSCVTNSTAVIGTAGPADSSTSPTSSGDPSSTVTTTDSSSSTGTTSAASSSSTSSSSGASRSAVSYGLVALAGLIGMTLL